MTITRKHLTLGLLALVSFLALATLLGYPLIDFSALAAVGVLPFAVSGELDGKGLVELLTEQGKAFDEFKKRAFDRLDAVEEATKEAEKKAGRPMLGGAGKASGETGVKYLHTKTGRELPFLSAKQSYADLIGNESEGFTIGDYVRDAIVGSSKAASGPALVPSGILGQVVDAVRRKTVIVEAGAGTIMIEGPTSLARLTQDPTVYQHTEGVEDIIESDVLAEPVTLNPKLLACLIPLSVEVVADSTNLDAVLNTALAGAFAAKLDALCIAKLLADTRIPKSAAAHDPANWLKMVEAIAAAMALDQGMPLSHISSPADFMARVAQLDTNGCWLGKPPALAEMRELFTTGLTSGTGLFGDFAAGFAVALRSELRVEVVRHQKPGSAEHLLVAHMRADGVTLQPGRLFKQLKTLA